MDHKQRIIASFRHGSAFGVVTEPMLPGGVPKEQRAQLWKVIIGPVDAAPARSLPFLQTDYETVIKEMLDFLQSEGLTEAEPQSLPKKRRLLRRWWRLGRQ